MPVRIVFSVEIITGSIFSNGLDQKFYYKEVHTSVKIPVPSAKKKKKDWKTDITTIQYTGFSSSNSQALRL